MYICMFVYKFFALISKICQTHSDSSSVHMGLTIDWGDDQEQGKGAAEGGVEEWQGQQSMSDREETDHFMGC